MHVLHCQVLSFVEWTRDKMVDVRFIELMPFDGIVAMMAVLRTDSNRWACV
jgi:molybdenum cofactor biosynthesis enzyme MoaA